MPLDLKICSRARLARDARFDGKFYIAVLTTRIYCRPICRARTSQEKNVRYFATAAAAAEAGFRPCLRCRPESSPGTAAWAGTKTTVSRALRLISQTGLEEGGIEDLAAHLGLGSRHLRRLFLRHLGASPRTVAQTRRLHFAKKLIDETALTMTQIADAAGFGSVRRFNAAVHKVYGRTPTALRARASQKFSAGADHQYLFQLNYRPPYRWCELLQLLGAQATPGVESVDGTCYRRTLTANGVHGHLEVSLNDERNTLDVRVNIEESRSLFMIIERVRAIFDLNADWPEIACSLRADPALAVSVRARPGLRVAGCWSGFEIAIQAILGAPAALDCDLMHALVSEFGECANFASGLTHLYPTAEALAEGDLTRAGLGQSEALAIRVLARSVHDGRISFDNVVDPDALIRALALMPGFTPRALEYVAMRAMREPDAFPLRSREVGVKLGIHDPAEIERRISAWRPWRAYAALYLDAFARSRNTTPASLLAENIS